VRNRVHILSEALPNSLEDELWSVSELVVTWEEDLAPPTVVLLF